MMIATAALTLPLTAQAAGYDPLRCEAVGMRKEGQLYECLGRCERRSARRGERPSAETDSRLAGCRQDCEERFNEAMDQLDERDICNVALAELDANRCHGRLLRVGATRLVCKSQCGARTGVEIAACVAACDDTCQRASQRVLSKGFCHGYVGPDLCSDHAPE
jgi:hypothetical protein